VRLIVAVAPLLNTATAASLRFDVQQQPTDARYAAHDDGGV
jgi:hypothetical protein